MLTEESRRSSNDGMIDQETPVSTPAMHGIARSAI